MIPTDANLLTFGPLLKLFRTRRRFTQQQLAEAIGVHRSTIVRWEQGDFLPESKTLVLELARHLRLDEQETRHLLEASLTALAPAFLIPLPRNPYFTGREEILEVLHKQLGVERAVALTQSSALHGLGGIGKTQIALEYAYRHALEYSAVFWIAAETEEQVVASLLRIAEGLLVPGRDDKDQQRVIAAVHHWLTTHDQWLLIWDNAEDLSLLDHFLPFARSGAILITTRCQTLGTFAQGLDLPPMEQKEGILFLLRRSKVLDPQASEEQVCQFATHMPARYEAAANLVRAMEGLPLALDQAGAYLEATHCGLPVYLNLFRTRRAALLKLRGEGVLDHQESVSTTLRLSITITTERHPAAWDLLRVCALLRPDAIPEELFRQGARHLGAALEAVCSDELEWNQVVAVTCSSSLLSRQPERRTLSLHRLVQAVLLDFMTKAEREQWTQRIITTLEAVFPEVVPAMEYAVRENCERLLPHAIGIVQQAGPSEESLPLAHLAHKAAQYLRDRGRYGQAEPLLQQALRIREQTRGPIHSEVATSLHDLAILYWEQGAYAQAEPCYRQALHIREQAQGTDHPEVAILLNDLALLYSCQGRYPEAEALLQRALRIWEQSPEQTDLMVAEPLQNLAMLYWHQDRYPEVEPLLQRALRIWEQALGPDHLQVVYPLLGLACLYMAQGKYAQAELLFQQALQMRTQALGPEHPYLAYPLLGLAEIYEAQGKDVQAELLYQQALQIQEPALGSEHVDVAHTLNGLANLFRDRGTYAEAEKLYRRALSLREQKLVQHHPDTAQTLHDLAVLCQKQSNLSKATSLAERALSIRLQSLGEANPKTIATRALCTQLVREQEARAEPTQEHLRTLLKARGWSVHLKQRHGKPFVYATRKAGQHTHSRYLAPLSNLPACLAAASRLPNAKEE